MSTWKEKERSLLNRVELLQNLTFFGFVIHPPTTEYFEVEFEQIGLKITNKIGTARRPVVLSLPDDLRPMLPAFALSTIKSVRGNDAEKGIYSFDEMGECVVPIQQSMTLGMNVMLWETCFQQVLAEAKKAYESDLVETPA